MITTTEPLYEVSDKRIDVGIITIIPREVKALFEVFGIDPTRYANVSGAFDYWETTLFSTVNNRELRVVVTFLTKSAGNTEAGISTTLFLRDWHPRIFCLVGIAAGVENKVRIGDVILPEKVHDLCVTVKVATGDLPRVSSRERDSEIDRMMKLRPLAATLLNDTIKQWIPDFSHILNKAKEKKLTDKEINWPLQLHDGSVVSSNRLLRDSGYFADVTAAHDEKCRGGDMESAGFTRACEIEDVPWFIVRGISDFGDDRKDDSFQELAAFSACAALRLILVHSVDLDQLPFHTPRNQRFPILDVSIEQELLRAYQNKRWDQTVTIGTFLSRPLWLSGLYELRKHFGLLVEDAAAKCDRNEERARALIDDLGWTSYLLKDRDSALKYIKDGIRLAVDIGNQYLVSKANRHLASISRQEEKYGKSESYLEGAEAACKQITDEADKREMDTSLLVSKSKLLLAQDKLSEAYDLLSKAKLQFEASHDKERAVKIYNVLGTVCNRMNRAQDALCLFDQGYHLAEALGRKDEMLSNARALVKSYDTLADIDKTSHWARITLRLSSEPHQIEIAKFARETLSRINQAGKKLS